MEIIFQTGFGPFTILLDMAKAPASCAYIQTSVMRGDWGQTEIYRIVTDQNQPDADHHIHVIQGGHYPPEEPSGFDYIPHEHTEMTGLSHQAYSVSLPRFMPGQVYRSFFICQQAAPELDFGGGRHPDGQGFAVCGQVIQGQEVVDRLYQQADKVRDFVNTPYPIQLR